MKRLLPFGLLILSIAFQLLVSRGSAADADATHNYRLDFRGTSGVKVRLLLITKPTSNAGPERREELVTLPSQIDFKAARCYAWIDTLSKGESGNDGDTCDVYLLKDGQVSATVATRIKKQNKQSGGLGDL